ncbi:hypothetical protein RF11_02758 [Thelohanellus kitauei]|uniref:Uncharacterized protein n=1 Tax=Thelohanellus kitauei TaxID=669202 RepID=A0A0C2J8C2_THEKT|nr:hypothetical protein RF11_02758 [Thelohanellus kitauei]
MGVIRWRRPDPRYNILSIDDCLKVYAVSSSTYTIWMLSSQRVLEKLSISTGYGRKGSIIAAIIIGVGNVLSCLTFSQLSKIFSRPRYSSDSRHLYIPASYSYQDIIVMFVFGILLYRFILWENFMRILPSDLTSPGAFCRRDGRIKAPDNPIITSTIRRSIQKIGKKYGCHSCGRKASEFIVDHIPPTSLFRNGILGQRVTQYLYPQCALCSHKQSKIF